MHSAEAMKRSGATYRQLDYWTRQGLLRPVGGAGSGFAREWPAREVDVARRMVELVDAGFPPKWAEMVSRLEPGAHVSIGDVRITLSPSVEEGSTS
jgi:DNA-binding transcriptional MerR regulator